MPLQSPFGPATIPAVAAGRPGGGNGPRGPAGRWLAGTPRGWLLAVLAALFYALFWILPFPLPGLMGEDLPWGPPVARVGPLLITTCGFALEVGVYFLGY